MDKLVKTQEIR